MVRLRGEIHATQTTRTVRSSGVRGHAGGNAYRLGWRWIWTTALASHPRRRRLRMA